MQIQSVLCVCTGNICRSPLAEGLLRRDAPELTVASAGIGAVVGGTMPEAAAAIAEREGLGLTAHRGRQISRPMIQSHDLVLVMEVGQREWLATRFPEARGRTFLANHWATGEDIQDPYRLSAGIFEKVYQELASALEQWRARLTPRKEKNFGTC